MKYCRFLHLFAASMLLLLAACGNQTSVVLVPSTPSPSTPSQVTPVVQQPLPKSLLNPKYPVMDWVYNVTCGRAVDSYSRSQMDATIAYDSAAWLSPSDGHLVEGSSDCDKGALISQARNQGLLTLLTVGVDSSWWSTRDLAQYIDVASSQQQVPCTPEATTYVCKIVNWAITGGYAGVIIDFELVKWDYPGIRMKFGMFMQELQAALHQKGMLCGVTLIPKASDSAAEDPHKLEYFQDWKLLSRIDFLVIMVLDLDLVLNKPGPITTAPWIEKQLNYLWKTIPQALSKTIWELPLYGREWQQNANGKWSPMSDETCQQVSDQKAAQTVLSGVSTDPTAPEIAWNDQIGNRHEVWYSTASSLVAIMTQIQGTVRTLLKDSHYKLPTSFWYRGSECANFFGTANVLQEFYKS